MRIFFGLLIALGMCVLGLLIGLGYAICSIPSTWSRGVHQGRYKAEDMKKPLT